MSFKLVSSLADKEKINFYEKNRGKKTQGNYLPLINI
jgi:hypothetical protein